MFATPGFNIREICTAVLCIIIQCQFLLVLAQRNSENGASRNSPSTYKDQVMIYPTGIRSERDLPVCPVWVPEEVPSKAEAGGHTPSFTSGLSKAGFTNTEIGSKLQQPTSTRNPFNISRKSDTPSKYLAACNIIHKRYFKPPMIERLCRCPDRTECPMEWSPPPLYKDLFKSKDKAQSQTQGSRQSVSTTPTTKISNSMDPFTVMISSRTQLKFCTEIAGNLPVCERSSHTTKNQHQHHSHNKDLSADDGGSPSMIKTIKKTFIAPELPSVSVNCYCPPLYRRWTFLSKNEPLNQANETSEVSFLYRCDRIRRCKVDQQCGNVRTDYHFSYYHCSCPRNNFCVPKIYPPISTEDVIEHVEEALYSGEAAPAFCSPS